MVLTLSYWVKINQNKVFEITVDFVTHKIYMNVRVMYIYRRLFSKHEHTCVWIEKRPSGD